VDLPTLETLSREKSQETINQLWVSFADAYGAKFTSNYGESPNSTWEIMIQAFTQEQIGRAFADALQDYPEWPPSLPQFVELCQGLNKAYLDRYCVEPSSFDAGYQNMTETQIRRAAEKARETAKRKMKRKLTGDSQYIHKAEILRLEAKCG